MGYTTSEQLRGYLVQEFPLSDKIRNQQIQLTGTEESVFFNGPIDENSIVIKGILNHSLTRTSISISATGTSIHNGPVVPGSVVVALDSSLSHIYTEESDYLIEYGSGVISLIEDSLLEADQMITVWFVPFHVFSSSDFVVDAEQGSMRRSGNSSIPDGGSVHIDYSPVMKAVTDEMIARAVTSANLLIEQEVDPNRLFEADPVLNAAATYRGLEIVSRVAAGRALSRHTGNERIAQGWMQMAEVYDTRSRELLRQFRPPFSGPKHPEHT